MEIGYNISILRESPSGMASASQADSGGFDSRFPLQKRRRLLVGASFGFSGKREHKRSVKFYATVKISNAKYYRARFQPAVACGMTGGKREHERSVKFHATAKVSNAKYYRARF